MAVTSLVLLASTSTAQAGGACDWSGCSEFTNGSHLGVLAVKHWNCSTGTTGTASEGCVNTGDTKWIDPGKRTPSGQDWDALRVDAGYCYKVEFLNEFPLLTKRWTMTYDRTKSTKPVYVKIENPSQGYVLAQKAGSCP
ncbi:hypothetical protein ACIF80_08185 [Streptomyces sp. NPDC085927]|uniref:hypothetical protein n=1 Tax=Streptomyces sp. NPDC085927 TaxID=3365738 RepID=UPI0037CE6088